MTCTSKPTVNGTYRIQVYNENKYVTSDPGVNAGLRLETLDTSNSKQRWILTNQGSHDWTITSAFDQAGLVSFVSSESYWGYGYPLPNDPGCPSDVFAIVVENNNPYAKIARQGNDYRPFDSCDPGSNAVHYYSEKAGHAEQKYVFELIQAN